MLHRAERMVLSVNLQPPLYPKAVYQPCTKCLNLWFPLCCSSTIEGNGRTGEINWPGICSEFYG